MQRLAPFPLPEQRSDAIVRRETALAFPGWLTPAALLGVIVVGAILRLGWAFQTGLHPDEALYASWALRIADGSDPALLTVFVDKPPFLPYLLAGIAWLMGQPAGSVDQLQQLAVAGRLAAAGAGVASLALVWGVAQPVYGRRVAALAVAALAVSPLATRLSPSLLTDPWLVFWMLLGLWGAVRQRPWVVGLAGGLAFAAKQQAVLLLPLLLCAAMLFAAAGTRRSQLWRLAGGFALVATVILWWDSLRWQWMPSYWDRSATAYGGLTLIPGSQAADHLAGWLEVLAAVLGAPLLLLLIVLLAARAVLVLRDRRAAAGLPRSLWSRARRFDALLLLFVAGYLGLHLATSLAPWDRYGLPLAPALAILLARAVDWWLDRLARRGQRRASGALAGVVAAGALCALLLSASPRFPVADNATYDGAPALADHIRRHEPAAVVYHRWFGWHYGFYLHGAGNDLRWWQSPQDLARQAAASGGQRQLVALPAAQDRKALDAALAEVGLALTPVVAATHPDGSPSALLYGIEPLAEGAAGD